MAVDRNNPKALIKYEELPRFNGLHIESIYAEYENSHYGRDEERDFYVADILYYKCYVHHCDCNEYTKNKKRFIVVKDLPKEFDCLFGKVENKGIKTFITNMWFRDSCSGNGSFDDESIHLGGWASNSTTGTLSLYRGTNYYNKPEYAHSISTDGGLGRALLNILNKSFKVKEVEFWECGAKMEEGSLDFACKYPYKHTPIRIIDKLVYPSEKLSSWRKYGYMPYRVPTEAFLNQDFFGVPDLKHLRVWDEDLKVHLYLERADDLAVGDENLIRLRLAEGQSDVYGNNRLAYCIIDRYNESCGYCYARLTITKKNKDGSFDYETYRNGEKMSPRHGNGTTRSGYLYRLNKIVNSNEK